MSQKRQSKNIKRKKSKPQLSKFERKQERIRTKIINDGLLPIRINLLDNLDKKIQASQMSSDNHRNIQ
jgi:hypothetical protein